MPITYILLSPTFGMHQYTADLAGRIANCELRISDGQPIVRLVTTATYPRDRYAAAIQVHTPIVAHGTGFSREGLELAAYRRVLSALAPDPLSTQPAPTAPSSIAHRTSYIPDSTFHIPHSDLIHFTGVHAWNLPLVYALRRRGLRVIHTLHDLDPHHGVRFSGLIRLWNRLILASGAHILVHGRRYRDRLLAQGLPPSRVTVAPLLHGFWGYDVEHALAADAVTPLLPSQPRSVIFFGRLEWYKGVDTLLAAWALLCADHAGAHQAWPHRLILAGSVAQGLVLPTLPAGVTLRDRRIPDDEGIALFREASLLVLPYRDATQSALIATAYRFGVPVIVTRTGALPEAVIEGETGWVIPPNDPPALAHALRKALLDSDRLAAMGAAGRAWFDQQRRHEEEVLSTLYLA